jgi:peptidoglycan-N-acetylglucosamine deacetylase
MSGSLLPAEAGSSTTRLAEALTSMASLDPIRRRLTPGVLPSTLSGMSPTGHVALTYDDGPDTRSTPSFLELLAAHQVRATFFVLGAHVGTGGLLREMVALGHEIAVHGWDHAPTVRRDPFRIRDELTRTRDVVEDLTGAHVTWYRPPYGWVTRETFCAARAAGLQLVLWSAWGRDWRRAATADSIEATVRTQLRPGGTVLLHDSDRTSAPGSWRATLEASGRLLARWRAEQVRVGPLREHWSAAGGGVPEETADVRR